MTSAGNAPLHRFVDLLLRWNATLNLIAARDAGVVWDRHVADSLQLVPLMPPDLERAIDLGTGGGFPGLVLAIATGVPFDLIESDRRKASFLRSAVLETGAPARVHCCRIEAACLPPAPLVTAPGAGTLASVAAAGGKAADAGRGLPVSQGCEADEELTAAEPAWAMTTERIPSRTSAEGVVLRVACLRKKEVTA